ncbi:MAG: c-type cytochrome domain-containing protein, partial [Pirellulales bacterium]
MRPAIALTSIWLMAACVAAADEIDFGRDIRPILSENCYHCHGPDAKKREAELRLDTRDGLLAKRDDLRVVAPGKPADSELIRRISSSDEDERMPPPETKLALSEREKNLLRAWIESGAEWNGHWSFEPIVRPAVPQMASDWPRNEIDWFVLARLQVQGLQPLKPAAKERLLRRVTLDLSGLPP